MWTKYTEIKPPTTADSQNGRELMKIRRFGVKRLFGEVDLSIPIADNKLILVGYNGIGKSTILNLFYYLISQQWGKVVGQDFFSISIHIEGFDEIEILRSEIKSYLSNQIDGRIIGGRRRYSDHEFDQVLTYINKRFAERDTPVSRYENRNISKNNNRLEVVENIASEFRLSISAADEIYSYYVSRMHRDPPLLDEVSSSVRNLEEILEKHLRGRILYLPTYRRIERDIKEVFPEFEEDIKKKLQIRRGSSRVNTYIELVEFGMEDVAAKITSRLDNIRGYALSQVNSLTGRYLRDVIRNEASKFSSELKKVNQETLSAVLEKVDDATLSESDKLSLNEVVEKINGGVPLEENEKYIAHYVTYLIEVGRNIAKLEDSVRFFAGICNSYLFGKRFIFDNKEYKLVIKRDSGRDVDLEQLSSGEKQIVSLFSHLILDDEGRNYIIIDEPELSLSVDWQQRFLEDISRIESCEFIGAVTHSPFIYENNLDGYAVDLFECEVRTQ